jgi:transposase
VEQIHDRVAGLDVHRDSVTVCSRRLGPKGGVVREKDRFTTTTVGLKVLADWLAERQVELVAMEATGVYWKPVYYALEHRFELWLCNARNVKKVPGRKTDLSDAEWLADVAAHGMVRPSFVPPPLIRELRELTRSRKTTQVDARVAEIQRLEKVLQDAGIKLTSVASKVLTQSGRAMIEALTGHCGPHHAVAAERILGHLDFLDTTIGALTAQIDARTASFDSVYKLLLPVPGLERPTIDVIVAETGADMSRFRPPPISLPGPACAPAITSRPANDAGSARRPVTSGYGER